MITYKGVLVNSFAYSYKYYMAHIYFYIPWGLDFCGRYRKSSRRVKQNKQQILDVTNKI